MWCHVVSYGAMHSDLLWSHVSRHGLAWHGMAWHGMAWHDRIYDMLCYVMPNYYMCVTYMSCCDMLWYEMRRWLRCSCCAGSIHVTSVVDGTTTSAIIVPRFLHMPLHSLLMLLYLYWACYYVLVSRRGTSSSTDTPISHMLQHLHQIEAA